MGALAKITSKGQVTIPLVVRKAMNLHSGDKIEFAMDEKGKFSLLKKTKSLDELFGILHEYRLDPPLTQQDIEDAISESVAERHPLP